MSVEGVHRTLTLTSKGHRDTSLRLHRFSLVGPSDTIRADPARNGRLFVVSKEDPSDLIPVSPHFVRRKSFRLGTTTYEVVMKEITTPRDLSDYEYLEGFHYKTSSAIVSDDADPRKTSLPGGRKAILIAYLRYGRRLIPAGYIELHMPLLMVRPRHVLFGHGFEHPSRPVSWTEWDVTAMKSYVNLIVRIARVVTSPDLRGLGLAQILLDAAKDFARERWHINGRRPLFVEISAEMLKYIDFVSSSGLHYLGRTEGNLNRIHDDLVSMTRGYAVSSGIMSLQKKYLVQLKTISKQLHRPLTEVLTRLRELTEDVPEDKLRKRLNTLNAEEWHLYKKVLRFPIPYFMGGLDEASDQFVAEHAGPAPKPNGLPHSPAIARIGFKEMTVSSVYKIPKGASSRIILDCFGLHGNKLRVNLAGPVTIEASGGNVILITGSSGSGKSVLLRMLDPAFNADPTLQVSVRDTVRQKYRVEWLREIDSKKPLIEYFSDNWGIESSISALNRAGLSEAFVYLRPYALLSRGQQYRARLAALCLGKAPVWLMDEFCADLDPFTAKIVARNLRKHVVATGRIAVVAAANNAHYVDALHPTRVIYLRHNGKSETMTYKEYADEFCHKDR
jgi:ABC-type transport system involved in cytochrome c biogenesis ATPase subunit/GNAT superfamily N-acetyltransferase